MDRKTQRAMSAYLGKFKEREMNIIGNQKFCSMCGIRSLFSEADTCDHCKNKFETLLTSMEDKSVQDHELDGSEAIEWVDGLPPVGTVCEYKVTGTGWYECLILAYWKEQVIYEDLKSGVLDNINKAILEFRHIKTPKEKAIEEKVMENKSVQDHELDGREVKTVSEYLGNKKLYSQEYTTDVYGINKPKPDAVWTPVRQFKYESMQHYVFTVEGDQEVVCQATMVAFRLIKSDKEKHVQKMWDVVCEDPGNTFKQLEALYDAGCRMPEV